MIQILNFRKAAVSKAGSIHASMLKQVKPGNLVHLKHLNMTSEEEHPRMLGGEDNDLPCRPDSFATKEQGLLGVGFCVPSQASRSEVAVNGLVSKLATEVTKLEASVGCFNLLHNTSKKDAKKALRAQLLLQAIDTIQALEDSKLDLLVELADVKSQLNASQGKVRDLELQHTAQQVAHHDAARKLQADVDSLTAQCSQQAADTNAMVATLEEAASKLRRERACRNWHRLVQPTKTAGKVAALKAGLKELVLEVHDQQRKMKWNKGAAQYAMAYLKRSDDGQRAAEKQLKEVKAQLSICADGNVDLRRQVQGLRGALADQEQELTSMLGDLRVENETLQEQTEGQTKLNNSLCQQLQAAQQSAQEHLLSTFTFKAEASALKTTIQQLTADNDSLIQRLNGAEQQTRQATGAVSQLEADLDSLAQRAQDAEEAGNQARSWGLQWQASFGELRQEYDLVVAQARQATAELERLQAEEAVGMVLTLQEAQRLARLS